MGGIAANADANVLVMAKEPVPGRVKTRLCPPFTLAEAAEIAQAALADTLEAVTRSGAGRFVLALDGRPGDWLPPGFEVIPQVAGGLDARLAAAWAHVGGPGVQIGMDTPQVTSGLLNDALARLSHADDAVLGPAEDGGWWAVGFHKPEPRAFLGVPMSTARTGEHQRARMRELGLMVSTLPTLRDIDTAEDAAAVAAMTPGSRLAVMMHAARLEVVP